MKAIIYEARPQAKRIKVHVPYAAAEWRKNIKALDSSFYHQEQKLWSVVNTINLGLSPPSWTKHGDKCHQILL